MGMAKIVRCGVEPNKVERFCKQSTFTFRIINLHETGIMKYLKRKYFNGTDTCGADLRAESSPLFMLDMWPVFVVLGVGLMISAVHLTFEIIKARTKPRLIPH